MTRVTRSPRLAAIGVAILSGLMLTRLDKIIMNIIRPARIRLANEAVDIQPAINTKLFPISISLVSDFLSIISVKYFKTIAPTDAKNPTTIAWALQKF